MQNHLQWITNKSAEYRWDIAIKTLFNVYTMSFPSFSLFRVIFVVKELYVYSGNLWNISWHNSAFFGKLHCLLCCSFKIFASGLLYDMKWLWDKTFIWILPSNALWRQSHMFYERFLYQRHCDGKDIAHSRFESIFIVIYFPVCCK